MRARTRPGVRCAAVAEAVGRVRRAVRRPGGRLAVVLAAVAVGAAVGPATAEAQPPDSLVRDSVARDSAARDRAARATRDSLVADSVARAERLRDSLTRATVRAGGLRAPRLPDRGPAPLTPRNAFFLSALVPGLSQTRLDRSGGGALFATIELGALLMLRRSRDDVREARRFLADSLPGEFTLDPSSGELVPGEVVPIGFGPELLESRELAVEDWIAVLAFNHLLSGADAFVSAQLWDVPRRIGLVPTSRGLALVASFGFGGPPRRAAAPRRP